MGMSHGYAKLKRCCVIALLSASPLLADLNEDRHPAKDILNALDRKLESLPENSIELPESADKTEPPSFIEEAGEDFVTAWQLYRSIAMRPPEPSADPTPLDRKDLINAYEERKLFEDLISRTIRAEPPPKISEYSRFTYSSMDWCGDGSMTFMSRYETGLILANIRHGKHLKALQLYSNYNRPSRDTLLRAFGADPEMFSLGAWLNKRCSAEAMCKTGGELTAAMMMHWIDLHHTEEMETRRIARETLWSVGTDNVPYFPRTEIMWLLRPENGVTDKTKTRIVGYIENKGDANASLGHWLYSYPKGAEKWLVPIALRCLEDPRNEIRERASKILRKSGVKYQEPERLPDVRFRVTVNGKPWPRDLERDDGRLHLTVFKKSSESGKKPKFIGDSLFVCDGDDFRTGDPYRAFFTVYPGFVSEGVTIPKGSQTLRGEIKLPVDFQGINKVDFKTTELTVIPDFSDRKIADENLIYSLNLAIDYPNRVAGAEVKSYILRHGESLYLPMVSEETYWLTVWHPGAAQQAPVKVKVDRRHNVIRPRLEQGTTLVVPVDWPEMAEPEKLPPELSRAFVWSKPSLQAGLRAVIRIKRIGDPSVVISPGAPESIERRFKNSVIFPYLPPGKYTVESPDVTIEPSGTSPGCLIRRSSIEVEIGKDSPVFVVTKPLEIHFTRKD